MFFKRRNINISNHYLKALKGVERSNDRITATILGANIESREAQWSKISVCMWVRHYGKGNK